MSQHRREQKIHAPEPQLLNPASFPWLDAGVLAELTIRATRTTSDIPERIAALKAGLATTQVPPDTRRRMEEAIFSAQGSVSHSKKFTAPATKTTWQSFAKQHQAGQKAILDNRLRTAERNQDATRREVETLDNLEAQDTPRMNRLNEEFDSVHEAPPGMEHGSSETPLRQTPERQLPTSPYKEKNTAKKLELERVTLIVEELRREQDSMTTAIYGSEFDADTISRAKALCALNQSSNTGTDLSQRHVIWDALVTDLLRILTKQTDETGALKATSADLISRMKVPMIQSAESTEVLSELRLTSQACQWAQDKLRAICSNAATEIADANARLIKAAEASCAERLKHTQVGAITGSFAPGGDNTDFLDYLSGIESTKHMFTQLLNKGGHSQHSLFAIKQEPDLVVTTKKNASMRVSHFTAGGQRKSKRAEREDEEDDSDDSEDGDADDPPPKPKRRSATRDKGKAVLFTQEPPIPTGPPPRMAAQQQYGGPPPQYPPTPLTVPPHERCRNDVRGTCINPTCVNTHSKFNKLSTEPCNAYMTPGMWCEPSYELNSHGCPYLHQMPARQHGRDAPYRSQGKGGPRSPAYYGNNPRSSAQSPRGRDQADRTCWYFTQAGGCKKGDTCDRIHDSKNV